MKNPVNTLPFGTFHIFYRIAFMYHLIVLQHTRKIMQLKEADKKLIARSELSSSDLADELTSYAYEMEAWENECVNPEMEDFWGIVTRIRLLAENL